MLKQTTTESGRHSGGAGVCRTKNKSCQECHRKKIKCDRRSPQCSLCQRLRRRCEYPIRQSSSRCGEHDSQAITNKSPANHRGSDEAIDRPSLRKFSGHIKSSSYPNTANLANVVALNADGENEGNRLTTSLTLSTKPEHKKRALLPPQSVPCCNPRLETFPDVTAAAWAAESILGYELFIIFFDKLSIGLLNRPEFMARYSVYANGHSRFVGREHLRKDEVFMINGMFALAARFSNSVEFAGIPVVVRGAVFGDNASTLMEDIVAGGLEEPTLNFVCGCVLLALFYFSDGQLRSGSNMTGVCLRCAYDLNLHAIDVQDLDQPSSEVTTGPVDPASWAAAEQRRRIWWNIWKIEVFSSSMACKPCSIDLRDVAVRLPVADADWFGKNPVGSAVLIDHPRTAWKTLNEVGSENPMAWFLLGLYLVSQANTALRRPIRPSPDFLTELSSSLCCFKLALPRTLSSGSICFDRNDPKNANWAVQTHIIVLTAESMIEDLQSQQRPSGSESGTSIDFLNRQESNFFEIVQVWPPSFIPLSEPLICGALGRIAVLARRPDSSFQTKDMSRLVLAKVAEYWRLGCVVLNTTEAVDRALNLDGPQEEHILNRLKFLWYSRPPIMLSDSRGIGQSHSLSDPGHQNFSVENNDGARSTSCLEISDGSSMWDHDSSPWWYSAIFADFLNGNVGEGWQEGNAQEVTERLQAATNEHPSSFSC